MITQKYIVTYSVYLCGGEARFVDTEDIAIKANKLAPGRFSWRKYPEFIDKEVVRTYLNDIKRNDKYVDGTGRRGWTLTTKGLKWVKENASKLENESFAWNSEKPKSGSVDSLRIDRELARLKNLKAWVSWDMGGGNIAKSEAREVFRIDSYADSEMIKLKISRLRNMFIENETADKFLKAAAKAVSEKAN